MHFQRVVTIPWRCVGRTYNHFLRPRIYCLTPSFNFPSSHYLAVVLRSPSQWLRAGVQIVISANTRTPCSLTSKQLKSQMDLTIPQRPYQGTWLVTSQTRLPFTWCRGGGWVLTRSTSAQWSPKGLSRVSCTSKRFDGTFCQQTVLANNCWNY